MLIMNKHLVILALGGKFKVNFNVKYDFSTIKVGTSVISLFPLCILFLDWDS